MTRQFKIPSEIKGTSYKLPGDFERSSYDSRPYVYPSDGGKRVLATRFTTFIDCLSERSTLEKWKQRIILTGLVTEARNNTEPNKLRIPQNHWIPWDSTLHKLLYDTDLDDRDAMNERAEQAFKAGDGELKAQQGTDMHRLTEMWDTMQPLPELDAREARDFAAFLQMVEDFNLEAVDIERRCVVDRLKAAGTPDRTYWYNDELVLGDLKTGTKVEHDPGKMAMQLALAAHGQWYDPDTYERTEMGVSQTIGLILHVPNGMGTATLYEADLVKGWEGVQLAHTVRQWRNHSKKALAEKARPLETTLRESLEELTP